MVDTVDTVTLMDRRALGLRFGGLTRSRVHQIVTEDPTFPAPIAEITVAQVWRGEDVEAWIDAYRPESSLRADVRATSGYADAA